MNVEKIVSKVDNYDAIADYVQQLNQTKDSEEFFDFSSGLTQVFGKLAKQKALTSSSNKVKQKIATWLLEQLEEFKQIEINRALEFPSVSGSTLLKIVLIIGKYLRQDVRPLVGSIAHLANENTEFCASVTDLVAYDDLRVFLLEKVVELEVQPQIVDLLCGVEKEVKTDEDLQTIYAGSRDFLPFDKRTAAQKYRALWQAAWLHILGHTRLSVEQIKQVLSVMHARIIPNFNRPHLLMDFLVDAYDHGGAISLLALNALFVLIQHFQLDYPQFFTKLYGLLEDGSLLVSSHRARFLRLLDLFLTSTHLPATIPASIIKRLARLCLFAPPGAIVAILPFVYNQLKRHPTCMVMIHRTNTDELVGTDPFDFDEKDPLHTHAIDSSLWELQTLTTHYHPNVASIAKIFSQPFKKPSYQLEHFLSHSYETLYTTEYNRKRDREPGLEFDAFNVFSEMDWVPN